MTHSCSCGFEQDKNDYSDHRTKCPVTMALENHITFPCLELLNYYYEPSKIYFKIKDEFDPFGLSPKKPRRHWALILNITQITHHCGLGFNGLNCFNEDVTFNFFHGHSNPPTTFSWSDIKKNNTAVILYAYKHDLPNLVGTEHLNSCYIFKASLDIVKKEAFKLLNDADMKSQNEPSSCFECGKISDSISRCSICKLAKYCSKVYWEGQKENFLKH